METISVIIPTWNRAPMIVKAIKSVLDQTLPVLEILVCDDGSTDDTFEFVKSFKNSKVKWIPGEHTGLPAIVRNKGIKKSRGGWIAFLDSDDEWLPKKLEKQFRLIKKTACHAVCSNALKITSKSKVTTKYFDYNKKEFEFKDLLKTNYVICSSVIIRKSLIGKCIGFPETIKLRTGQDYAFWLRVSTQTKFAYLKEALVYYFDEPSKSIRRLTKNPKLQKKFVLQDFLSWGIKNKVLYKYLLKASVSYLKTSLNT